MSLLRLLGVVVLVVGFLLLCLWWDFTLAGAVFPR